MSPTENNPLTELIALEAKLDTLIDQHQTLKDKNRVLESKLEALTKENSQLLEKTNQAKVRVEQIIERLKVMEQES